MYKRKTDLFVKVTYGKKDFKNCLLDAIKTKYEDIN